MGIRVLPPEMVAKIAAGEVIERPASAVKELVENSIDAAATNIRVEARQGGRRLVQVADDGVGIPSQEVELAFARHATSKVVELEDLSSIRTLGFRGEALASIAAVAQVEMVTRTEGEAAGTYLRLEGGNVVEKGTRGAPRGTLVRVEHLFHNLPARRKFLRSVATEEQRIADLLARYALGHPNLRFSLAMDGRLLLRTTGGGDLRDALAAVYGLETAREMLPVEASDSVVKIFGYISPPHLHRAARSYMTFLVNGRWVQDPMLSHALEQAYHSILPQGRHPIVVVHLSIDPSQVDVNIHPTKREVRFLRPNDVFVELQKTVRRALTQSGSLPSIALHPQEARAAWGGRPPPARAVGQLGLEVQRTAAVSPQMESSMVGRLPALRVLGQVAQSYIIAEGPEGLYLIDQHAAHERVLYERFQGERTKGALPSQALLEPVPMELTPEQAATIESRLEALRAVGFGLEPFGERVWLVRGVPASMAGEDPRKALPDLLDGVEKAELDLPWEERLAFIVACHGAIPAGQVLTPEEMRELVRQLEATAHPHTCPHGRPTMVLMSAAQLEREFGRR